MANCIAYEAIALTYVHLAVNRDISGRLVLMTATKRVTVLMKMWFIMVWVCFQIQLYSVLNDICIKIWICKCCITESHIVHKPNPLLWRHITPYHDELDVLSTYSVDRLLTLLFITSSKKWVGKAQRNPELDENEWCNSTHPQIFPLEILAGISCTTQEVSTRSTQEI